MSIVDWRNPLSSASPVLHDQRPDTTAPATTTMATATTTITATPPHLHCHRHHPPSLPPPPPTFQTSATPDSLPSNHYPLHARMHLLSVAPPVGTILQLSIGAGHAPAQSPHHMLHLLPDSLPSAATFSFLNFSRLRSAPPLRVGNQAGPGRSALDPANRRSRAVPGAPGAAGRRGAADASCQGPGCREEEEKEGRGEALVPLGSGGGGYWVDAVDHAAVQSPHGVKMDVEPSVLARTGRRKRAYVSSCGGERKRGRRHSARRKIISLISHSPQAVQSRPEKMRRFLPLCALLVLLLCLAASVAEARRGGGSRSSGSRNTYVGSGSRARGNYTGSGCPHGLSGCTSWTACVGSSLLLAPRSGRAEFGLRLWGVECVAAAPVIGRRENLPPVTTTPSLEPIPLEVDDHPRAGMSLEVYNYPRAGISLEHAVHTRARHAGNDALALRSITSRHDVRGNRCVMSPPTPRRRHRSNPIAQWTSERHAARQT
ncbi:hypothetical protein HU200_055309 [Digitaria exilis]|uniref:Uncharacterized protein n=1 Tax=Digitaria exilis TaxID=1010633 RepID=A0A835E1U8_9POAL|nr:hypothetical protein HU200_055309 [Digitaria exilis]